LCNLYLMRLLLFIALTLSINKSCLAQKELSDDEVQYFYSLIKQMKEYKLIFQRADSFNHSDPANPPQTVKLQILKKESDEDPSDYIFWATMSREFSFINMGVENYFIRYNKYTKKIVSVDKSESIIEVRKLHSK
jgi:hypothetical protein